MSYKPLLARLSPSGNGIELELPSGHKVTIENKPKRCSCCGHESESKELTTLVSILAQQLEATPASAQRIAHYPSPTQWAVDQAITHGKMTYVRPSSRKITPIVDYDEILAELLGEPK
jgi:hypothetical protein